MNINLNHTQSSRIERQPILHVQRSVTNERRGSPEETRRILQEIEKINHSLGYRRRPSYAYPRVSPPSPEGYFYPRQTFRPEFLTKPKQPVNIRFNGQRAISPFSNQNYFYPTPYLQTPQSRSPDFFPLIYAPISLGPIEVQKAGNSNKDDGSVRLGTIVVLSSDEQFEASRESKAIDGTKKAKQNKLEYKPTLLEEIARIVGDEQQRQASNHVISTVRAPMLKNDKYLNFATMKDQPPIVETKSESNSRSPPPVPHHLHRAFNFTSSIERIQNFTKKFQVVGSEKSDVDATQADSLVETTSLSPLDLEEQAEDAKDDKEDEKSPFGLLAFGPKQQLSTFKEGGLIIQRLRVRQGGIAIAGPGGVATVSSRLRFNHQWICI